jgi:hypothetical protein
VTAAATMATAPAAPAIGFLIIAVPHHPQHHPPPYQLKPAIPRKRADDTGTDPMKMLFAQFNASPARSPGPGSERSTALRTPGELPQSPPLTCAQASTLVTSITTRVDARLRDHEDFYPGEGKLSYKCTNPS